MRIRIKAPYEGAPDSGIYDGEGKALPIGAEFNVSEAPAGWAGRYDIVSGGESDEGKRAVLNAESGEVEIGDTKESGRTGQPVGDVQVGPGESQAAETNKLPDVSTVGSAYAIRDKGRGWWVVTKDGEDATRSFRDEDLKGFSDLSEDDKAAFVKANPKD